MTEGKVKRVKTATIVSSIIFLVLGLGIGYCLSYFPMQKKYEDKDYSFKYYRDKYLDQCELYEDILDIAGSQSMNDYQKLYLIRSTYNIDRMHELNGAKELKRKLERNKDE